MDFWLGRHIPEVAPNLAQKTPCFNQKVNNCEEWMFVAFSQENHHDVFDNTREYCMDDTIGLDINERTVAALKWMLKIDRIVYTACKIPVS